MANAFTLWAELRSDSQQFERSMDRASKSADEVTKSVSSTQRAIEASGKTSATTSRQFERLNNTLTDNKTKLRDAAQAFQQGSISARQMATVFNQVDRSTAAVNNRLKDLKARIQDIKSGGGIGGAFNNNQILAGLSGGLVGGGIAGTVLAVAPMLQKIASTSVDLGQQSVQLAADFQMTRKAMELYAGSAIGAEQELSSLAELSRKTPGLGLEDAEKGALRLRAMGFEANVVKDLLVGLSKQKILSGVGSEAIDRVTTNLAQLASGGGDMQDVKELVQNLPTIRKEINEAFGSLEKFRAALASDPTGAIKKLVQEIKGVQSPAGGANDAIQKLMDSFTEAGRAFGEPILEPLTNSVKDLTQFVRQNRGEWKEWGETVADAFRGATVMGSGFLAIQGAPDSKQRQGFDNIEKQASAVAGMTPSYAFLAKRLSELGEAYQEAGRKADEAFKKMFPKFQQGMLRDDFTVDFDMLTGGKPGAKSLPGASLADQKKEAIEWLQLVAKGQEEVRKQINQTVQAASQAQQTLLAAELSLTQAKIGFAAASGQISNVQAAQMEGAAQRQALAAQLAGEKARYDILLKNADVTEKQGILLERNTKLASLRSQMEAQSLVNATRQLEAIKAQKSELTNLFSGFAGADNPFVQIFTQGAAAIERIREATKGLGGDIRAMLVGMAQAETAQQEFRQSLDNNLKAFSLRQDARRFDPNFRSIDRHLRLIGGGSQLQRDIDEQLRIISGGSSFSSDTFKVLNAIDGKGGTIGDKVSKADSNQRDRDRRIIALFQGIDAKDLSNTQRNIALNASLREAKALEGEKDDARAKLNAALDNLTTAINGGSIVRIINEAPDNAKVSSRPRRADSNAYFGK